MKTVIILNKNKQMELDFSRSIIEPIQFRGKDYLLKRDDLIHPEFSGNKARKFYYYFQADLSAYHTLVSYGGNQSNAMYSLSALAKLKNKKFKYYSRPLPKFLRNKPIGNFLLALENGMQFIKIDSFENIPTYKGELFIVQGGREPHAEPGVKLLAEEITSYAQAHKLNQLSVFLPSGTGSTAVFLQKHLKFPVYTTPCVGDESYLREQFTELVKNKNSQPKILHFNRKYAFGKPYGEFYNIWKEVQQATQRPFDLLYDPLGWKTVDYFYKQLPKPIIYVQCGGLSGNETMEKRYLRKDR